MIKAIIFSKDRPMQLRAHLESLIHYTQIDTSQIYVIIDDERQYFELISDPNLMGVRWVSEKIFGDFHSALHAIIDGIDDDDHILWGCDDVVWFRFVNLNFMAETLNKNKDAIGFSLRLGVNVCGFDPRWTFSHVDKMILKFNWHNKPSHFGYPFELMQSMYKGNVVKSIVGQISSKIRIPNDLESQGVQFCHSNPDKVPSHTIMFNGNSFGGAIDINRTQDLYQNRIQGGQEHSVDALITNYKKGQRINWVNYYNMVPSDCFLGTRNLLFFNIK